MENDPLQYTIYTDKTDAIMDRRQVGEVHFDRYIWMNARFATIKCEIIVSNIFPRRSVRARAREREREREKYRPGKFADN